jgi:hypothetical protein
MRANPRAARRPSGHRRVRQTVDKRALALALPSHVPAATAKGFTLSIAKQVLSGKMDEVIETVEHNVRLL